MDLELKDISELLHITEERICEWAQAGKIPSYMLCENEYRFNSEEIENWLIENPHMSKKGEKLNYSLYRACIKGDVYTDIEGSSKEEIFEKALLRIENKLELDPNTLYKLVLEREQLAPTGLQNGFAVPHARDFYLPALYDAIFIVSLPSPIEYDSLDGKPVHTLFFLFSCDAKRHLRLLARLAHLINDDKMNERFLQRPSKAEVLPLIKKWEANLKM